MTVIICSQKKNGKMSYYRSWDEGFLGPLSLSIRVSPVSAKAFRITRTAPVPWILLYRVSFSMFVWFAKHFEMMR